ncbi:MAG: UrcA family protein [Parvularculaceae bacterium]
MRPLAPFFIAFASLSAAAAFASPASAGEFSFAYRTSELSSSRGVAALYERIDAGAEAKCARYGGAASLVFKRAVAVCRDDVMSQLVGAIDNPALSAMHEDAHSGRFASLAR